MNDIDFINEMVGKPWVNRADTLEQVDCYGLVSLYYRLVLGVELPVIEGYKQGFRFDSLWRKEIRKTWRQVGRWERGAMVTFYDNKMNPAHVGICIGNQQVLHARGSEKGGGKVEVHAISVLSKLYKTTTFHGVINA